MPALALKTADAENAPWLEATIAERRLAGRRAGGRRQRPRGNGFWLNTLRCTCNNDGCRFCTKQSKQVTHSGGPRVPRRPRTHPTTASATARHPMAGARPTTALVSVGPTQPGQSASSSVGVAPARQRGHRERQASQHGPPASWCFVALRPPPTLRSRVDDGSARRGPTHAHAESRS